MSTSGSGCLLGYKFMDLGSCSGKCANTFYFHRIFYYYFVTVCLYFNGFYTIYRWYQSTRNCLGFYFRGRWVSLTTKFSYSLSWALGFCIKGAKNLRILMSPFNAAMHTAWDSFHFLQEHWHFPKK